MDKQETVEAMEVIGVLQGRIGQEIVDHAILRGQYNVLAKRLTQTEEALAEAQRQVAMLQAEIQRRPAESAGQ